MRIRISSSLALAAVILFTVACGTYRITYVHSKSKHSGDTQTMDYAHGFGLVGGGGFFFAIHRMIPCFVDWTGPVDLSQKCPDGFYKIDQYQSFGQNTAAAFLSWVILINPYHPSTVEIKSAQANVQVDQAIRSTPDQARGTN